MRPPEPFTFFIDRCLGRYDVPNAVRLALRDGETLRIHDEILEQNAPDDLWLPMVAEHGWVVLSKDPSMRRTPLIANAILVARAAVFHLANGQASGQTAGRAFVAALPRIRKAVRRFDVAVVRAVNIAGEVTVVWANGEKLSRPIALK